MNVTLYKDYHEEGWKSMDIYAEQITKTFKKINSDIYIKNFSALPSLSKHFPYQRKKIRYFFRYIINPLFATLVQGHVNHIIDQANAHLLFVLNPKKTVITCHDLIVPFWNKEKGYKNEIKKWRMSGLSRAAKIITVSKFTRRVLIDTLDINTDKISVIPNGIEEDFRRITNTHRLAIFRKTFQIPKSYLLHVGTVAKQKNIEGILRFFSQAIKNDSSLYFIKIGQPLTKEQQEFAQKTGVYHRIIQFNNVSREDLACFYTCAKALVHLSWIEGFGLTVLEAMRCGCPVILSDIPVLKELAEEVGIYVRLNSIESDVTSIQHQLATSSYIQKYKDRSIQMSNRYSWLNTAKQLSDIYKEIHSRNI